MKLTSRAIRMVRRWAIVAPLLYTLFAGFVLTYTQSSLLRIMAALSIALVAIAAFASSMYPVLSQSFGTARRSLAASDPAQDSAGTREHSD